MTDEKFRPTIGDVEKYLGQYMSGKTEPHEPKDIESIKITGPGYKANLSIYRDDRNYRIEVVDLPFGVANVEGINTYPYGAELEGFASVVVPLVISQATRNERLPEIKYGGKKPLCFALDAYRQKEVEFYRRLEKATLALVDIDRQLTKYYNKKMKDLLEPYGCDKDLIETGFAHKVA